MAAPAAEGAIDLAKINRKIWLVKVPNAVAQAWRPLCEAAMNPSNLEEDAPQIQLGTVRVEQSQTVSWPWLPGLGSTAAAREQPHPRTLCCCVSRAPQAGEGYNMTLTVAGPA